MVSKRLPRGKVSQGAGLLIINILFFGTTDPARAPSVMFIVAFVLATLSVYWLASTAYSVATWYGLPLKHKKRAVLSITGSLMSLVALQSIGQLGSREIVILLPFVVIAYFYISYQQRSVQTQKV